MSKLRQANSNFYGARRNSLRMNSAIPNIKYNTISPSSQSLNKVSSTFNNGEPRPTRVHQPSEHLMSKEELRNNRARLEM